MAKNKSENDSEKKIGGPFLNAALFCEAIMEDANGKPSALGILDGTTFYLPHDAPSESLSEDQAALLQQHILLTFRSGDSPGKHKLRIVVQRPDGKRKELIERDIELSKPANGGANIKLALGLSIHGCGVHWFDVYLGSKRMTRMPLNVAVQRLPKPPSAKKGSRAK